jgi:hypothetical protein
MRLRRVSLSTVSFVEISRISRMSFFIVTGVMPCRMLYSS